jgi:ABC-type enterobactin transport system permease subunit
LEEREGKGGKYSVEEQNQSRASKVPNGKMKVWVGGIFFFSLLENSDVVEFEV